MRKPIVRTSSAAALLALAGLLSGCDEGVGVDAGAQASISFATIRSSALLDIGTAADPVVIGEHTVDVTSAELRISEIEIEGDEVEIKVRNKTTVVALPVTGSTDITTPITAPVVPGTYDELKLKIQSVRVMGTFDGEPFDLTLRVNEHFEMDLEPPLVVTETGAANATVTVAVDEWFLNRDGSAIDPNNLTDAEQARLRKNIRESLRAFEDDDCDGRHGHGGRDRGHR